MAKIYFEKDEAIGYALPYWRDYMKENHLSELTLHEGKREVGSDYFWCSQFEEIGEKGEGCGKSCEKYAPRNGKNGRCRFSQNTFEMTDNVVVLSLSD